MPPSILKRWESFLATSADITNANGAALFINDLPTGTASGVWTGYDEAEIGLYLKHYTAVNPWRPDVNFVLPESNVIPGELFLPMTKLRGTEFYTDWGKRNDVVYTWSQPEGRRQETFVSHTEPE